MSKILEKLFSRGYNHGLLHGQSNDGESYAVADAHQATLDLLPKEIRLKRRVLMQEVYKALTIDYFRDGYEEGFNAYRKQLLENMEVGE